MSRFSVPQSEFSAPRKPPRGVGWDGNDAAADDDGSKEVGE